MSDDNEDAGSGPKVVSMPPQPDKLRAALEETKRSLPMILENAGLLAQIRWANYKALLDAGFNEQQALELCWK